MARRLLMLVLALMQHEDAYEQSEPFELYSNFDISHLIRPDMNWYELLDIRQQLRRPSLAFYVDKVQYKTRMKEVGIDIPKVYYMQNADHDRGKSDFQDILRSIKQSIDGRRDYVAKPTHMSCSDTVYVVKDGWNIYPKLPEPVQTAQVAADLINALGTQSSLLGESWALHQVPPGVIVEERISAGGEDGTAALEFKTIVIWGSVWASDVRRGTDTVQYLGRDGRDLLNQSLHPSLVHVDWPRVRELAERLGAHKDCFRVDIFVSPSSQPNIMAESIHSPVLNYQVNEVEFYITSSLPLFDEAARLWLEGYSNREYTLIPNNEVSGAYADMQDPSPEEERTLFAELKLKLGWEASSVVSRTYGSLAPRPHAEVSAPQGNLSVSRSWSSSRKCTGKGSCPR